LSGGGPAQHHLDLRRRPRIRRCRLLWVDEGSDAEHRPAGAGGLEIHGRSLGFGHVHAVAFRLAHGGVCLAETRDGGFAGERFLDHFARAYHATRGPEKGRLRDRVVGKWHLGLGDGAIDWNGEIKPGPFEVGFDYGFIIPATGDRVPCVYVENDRALGLDPNDPIRISYDRRV
jgi:hypothetical protein